MKGSVKRIVCAILAFVCLIAATGNCLHSIVWAVPTNLLKNSGFETYSDGDFADWGLWKGNHGNTLVEQGDGRTGKSAKISVKDNSGIVNFYQNITLEENSEYVFSAWIKLSNIVRQWETAPGVYISLSYNNNITVTKSATLNADTDWQKIEVVVDSSSLSGSEEVVLFDLVIEYVKGDVYIDDACVEKKETTPIPDTPVDNELLKNNGFETYSAGVFENWDLWKGNHGNSSIVQAEGRTGKSAKISVKDNSSIVNFYQSINLEANKKYTFSAWVKLSDIVRQWETAPGVYISLSYNNNITVTKSATLNADSDWQKIEVVVDSSSLSGSEEVVLFDLAIEYVKGDVYIDDAAIAVAEDKPEPEPEPDTPINPDPPTVPDEDDKEDNETKELLKNKEFETFSGGTFENWNLWKGNHGNSSIVQAEGRTGKSAKISVKDNSSIVNFYQAVNLEANKKYTFSAWVKLSNIVRQWETAPGVYLSFSYNNNLSITKSAALNTDTDWQKIEFVIDTASLKGDEEAVLFDLVIEYVKGDVYIDDAEISLAQDKTEPENPDSGDEEDKEDNKPNEGEQGDKDEKPVSKELLKNKGFETYSGDNFADWSLWKGNHNKASVSQVKGRTGNAAKITVKDNSSIVNFYQSINLEKNKKYTFSVWIKLSNIVRQWDTAPGVYLSLSYDNNISVTKSTAINADTAWQKIEFVVDTASLKENEKTILFDIVIEYVKGEIFVDDANISLFEGGNTTGDSPTKPNDGKGDTTDENQSEIKGEQIKNKGFETYSAGEFADWNFWKGNHGNTKLTQSKGRTGKGAKITVDNNNNTVNLYQGITMKDGYDYILTAWIKTENIKLQWDDANGVYLALSYNNNIPVARSELIKTDSNWQKLQIVVNNKMLKGDEWGVQLDIVAEYLTGVIYVDDVEFKLKGKTSNSSNVTPSISPNSSENTTQNSGGLLKNKGFEIFTGGKFTDWTLWKGNKGNTEIEQVKGRTGRGAKIAIDNNQNIVNLYQEITLDPKLEYTFTVWVKTENIELQWPGAQGVYVNLSCNNNKILMSESVNSNSGWQKLEVVVNGGVLKGDEWSVRFDIAAEYLTGNVYIDDANIKVTGKATKIPEADKDELLQNNGFEIYSAGNFANWNAWKGNKGNTKVEQADGRTGKAAKITVDNNNNIVNLYQEIKLDPTLEYTFTVWVKTENILLQWPGAQGVYLNFKYNNNVILMSKTVNADSDWQKLEIVVNGGILKGDEWGVSLDIAAEFLTGTIYIDDASVKVTGKGTPVPQKDDDELLENGGFELYSGYNFARWNLNRGNNGNTKLSQVENGRTGKAAKVTVDDYNNIVALYQNITLDPAYEYTFSVWVKVENYKPQWDGAPGVYLAFGYNNLTPLKSECIKTDCGWTKLELVVGGGVLKGDEWGVMFAITTEFIEGTVYIDDASMKITGKYDSLSNSLLKNGGFDDEDEEAVIANWTSFSEDSFTVFDRSSTMVKDGLSSAQIFNTDGNIVSYWEQKIENLDVKKQYSLSGYIYSDFIVSENNGAAAFVEFYDPDGNLIKTVRSDYVKGEQSDWNYFELKLAFPENCFTMVVKAGLTKAVGTAYFDKFSLVEYEEDMTEAKEGIFENLFFMGIAEENEVTSLPLKESKNILPIAIIGGASLLAVLAGVGIAFFAVKKRKNGKG